MDQLKLHRYLKPSKEVWRGRLDSPVNERFHEVIKLADLEQGPLKLPPAPTFGIVGFACDAGVKRNQGSPGASYGPRELRKALARLPFAIQNKNIYDFGDLTCLDDNLEEAQEELARTVCLLLKEKVHPIVLGGGHEVAWANFSGIAKAFPSSDIAIVNFDAHFDLRPLLPGSQGSSGTPFTQIALNRKTTGRQFSYYCIGIQTTANTPALFAKAAELKTRIVTAEELYLKESNIAHKLLDKVIADHEFIYLTLCMDVFSSAYAPGVSAPQPLGLTPWQILPLIVQLARSGKVISFDVAELNPSQDKEGLTAALGASLLSYYLHQR